VEHQHRQEGAVLAPGQLDESTSVTHFQGTEDSELHVQVVSNSRGGA